LSEQRREQLANRRSGNVPICAGQTGSVGVRLRNPAGGGLPGRLVSFEVIQGHFRFFTSAPGQLDTFALSYTVASDQDGNAVARVKADISAPQEIVTVQATDVATGAYVRGVFLIQQLGTATPNVVPDEVTITGPDSETCSSGVITTFYVFGGHPPYALGNPFPQFLQFSQATVATSGSGFNVTTLGGCVDDASISVTDSTGQTSIATLTNELGTLKGTATTTPIPINVSPSPILALSCGASTSIVLTGGGSVNRGWRGDVYCRKNSSRASSDPTFCRRCRRRWIPARVHAQSPELGHGQRARLRHEHRERRSRTAPR
jgi:hypothetical protein